MKNNNFAEMSFLYLMNELGENEKILFEELLNLNDKYKAEYENIKKLHKAALSSAPLPVKEEILQEARSNLLDALSEKTLKPNYLDKIKNIFMLLFNKPYKLAAAGAAVFVAGILLGFYLFSSAGYSQNQFMNEVSMGLDETKTSEFVISDIRLVNPRIIGNEIELEFNIVKPLNYKGDLNDPLIQKLIAAALVKQSNPGLRLQAVNALAHQTEQQGFIPDEKIKKSLIEALKVDDNAAVRKEALEVLKKFTFDSEIRDAILFVLSNDQNSGMRVAAVNALSELKTSGVNLDDIIRERLQNNLADEENNYIKIRTASILEEIK